MKTFLQKFGRALSAMVMPNIGAFIAWGLIMAIFINNGWWPNEHIYKMADPMMKFLLPILIAYTAGRNVYGERGGVIGAIATVGVVIGSDIPMFIGAMAMGPLSAWCIKQFDEKVGKKASAGFEMLVDNFSLGIMGMLFAILGYLFIGGVVEWFTNVLKIAMEYLINHKLLPLASFFIEPGKVLFLNNAINHGIFDVLGVQQAQELGKSIIFLIETNPGPGLGVLLACWAFGHGTTKQSAPGAVIIHFLGGIHEIYFPYILSQPALIIAPMLGGASALLFFSIFGAGLIAPAAPGSVIALLAMAPKGQTLLVLAGILLAAAVSFLVAAPIVKMAKAKEIGQGPAEGNGSKTTEIKKVVFSCDAGMGSSALGATNFRSKLNEAGISGISCTNCAIENIPEDASVVVCHKSLAERAAGIRPGIEILSIENFIGDPVIDALLGRIKEQCGQKALQPAVIVGLSSESKEDAIRRAGAVLVQNGCVKESYPEAMLEREAQVSTYMGMGLAIPHGTSEAKADILKSGIAVLQYPDGVDFGDEKAYLVIGIAGAGDEHMDILSHISTALGDEKLLNKLYTTSDASDILNALK